MDFKSFTFMGAPPPTSSPDILNLSHTQEIARPVLFDLILGIVKSKFFLPFFSSALLVGGLFTFSHFVLGNSPEPWMLVATVAGGYAVGLLIQLPFKGIAKIQFEFSALQRLGKKENFNEIEVPELGSQKLFLGALPNRLLTDGEKLVHDKSVGAILSINEEWERTPQGLSIPYTEEDWETLGVCYHAVNIKDHTFLSIEAMNEVADFIDNQLKQKRNVYVHCRAGVGRSAMAIAAYLIGKRGYKVAQTMNLIRKCRPESTIEKKEERLNDYYTHIHTKEK